MKLRRVSVRALVMAGAALAAGAPLSAQRSYSRSDFEIGARMYQGSCATCHGPKGDAVRGVALLSGRFQHASTDEELAKIIVAGIPGTAMPPNNYSDIEVGFILAYLRGTAAGDGGAASNGNAERGKALFEGKGKCATCHNASSRMAPSLSDVGLIRRQVDLERFILDPESGLNPDYRFVRVVTKTGAAVTGRLLNQSTFSVQILDSSEKLRSFDKSSLREMTFVRASPMPSSRGTLDPQEVTDVVTYLTTLRGQR
jgi:putative heme-binding domain-containing protein